MDKEGTIKYYSATKKEILPFAMTSINLESIMLSKINETEKEKCSQASLNEGDTC